MREGERIVAVINTSERGGSASKTSLANLARLWQAEYYAMHCESNFELLDGLEEGTFALLDIQPDPEQSRAFAARCRR